MYRFENLNEFKKQYPTIAEKLLSDVGKGEWGEDDIYFFEDLEEYAEHELYDGWYSDCNFDMDFRGAPNPINYIDMKAFANALTSSWDDSLYWTDGEVVVETIVGW